MHPQDISERPRPRRSRPSAPALAVGAAVALAAVLAVTVPELTDRPGSLPAAGAQPDGSDLTPSPAASAEEEYPRDRLGYPASGARCDGDQELVTYGRTARALVVICVDPTGELEYHGVRLSDAASLRMPAGRTADGSVVATNEGVTYAVSPEALLVSEGDTVLYRDAWAEFGQPSFPGGTISATASATGSTPTVSTTTVTVTTAPEAG